MATTQSESQTRNLGLESERGNCTGGPSTMAGAAENQGWDNLQKTAAAAQHRERQKKRKKEK